ncbi:hypothetical protein O998_02170 [Anaplasma phagocytophilum str. Norway variant1]|uniref:Peptide chain release factor 2 n=1 Tax=Anaplasma phagocytophilum str. Norway variant1 TaxID=1392506 RepID=A0A7H9DYQ5_ANAPH|nr:hypothetical protein O998_02170 [Anaplasma phagocytophilum str. Norway variant1]
MFLRGRPHIIIVKLPRNGTLALYKMHPYRMVKDLRTEHETGNVDAVMNGDLDAFITAALMRGSLAKVQQSGS